MVIYVLYYLYSTLIDCIDKWFYGKEISVFNYDIETSQKLFDSTPRDQLLIQSSNAMAALILFVLGLVLFMVALETWKGQKGPELFC